MKQLILFTLLLTLIACGQQSAKSASSSGPDFSAHYKAWTIANGLAFTWSAAGLAFASDDQASFCDCTITGSGDESAGSIRTGSCVHRGNPALTATKCTGALIWSDFNFTFNGTALNMCVSQTPSAYDYCEIAL